MLAGTWNSNVCPGLAVSGTVSATWSWLGCALEEEFGQGLCRARVESGHLLPERRDPHELLPRYPCLRDVCLHRRHLLSRWRWHLAQRGRRRFRLWCRVSARMAFVACRRYAGIKKRTLARKSSAATSFVVVVVVVYRTTSIHGVEAPGQNSDTYTALGWSRRTTVHAPWAHREAAWAAEEPPTREAGHALDTHHAHTAN